MSARPVNISKRGRDYFATVDGEPEFFVGRQVSYQGGVGLMNDQRSPGGLYSDADYEATFGFWARLLRPTAECESSRRFACLNTYDRARFTYGFLQFAAHVPNGDFVVFFRRLLARAEARGYFPDLSVRAGHVHRDVAGGFTPLEADSSTDGLMGYLTPTLADVEESEVVHAARLIHWTATVPDARILQVDQGVSVFRAGLRRDHGRYDLDGRDDTMCAIVEDIHHQGRASVATVRKALDADDPYEALLAVGVDRYPERCATLRRVLGEMTQAGRLGTHRYDAAGNQFVAK